jgi:hypothetical protein
MSDAAIKAALEVANKELRECFDAECDGFPVTSSEAERIAASAIAAFLRHFSRGENLYAFTVPDAWQGPGEIRIICQQLDGLAAAVERAAGGGG